MAQPRDDSFDWVTARSKCSLRGAFQILTEVVETNVERANALPDSNYSFESKRLDQRLVVTATLESMLGQGYATVVFHLRDSEIAVTRSLHPTARSELAFSAKPCFTAEGDCVLEVDGVPLQLWQVSRKALEPLFFEL
jgi:hypothetical protein